MGGVRHDGEYVLKNIEEVGLIKRLGDLGRLEGHALEEGVQNLEPDIRHVTHRMF